MLLAGVDAIEQLRDARGDLEQAEAATAAAAEELRLATMAVDDHAGGLGELKAELADLNAKVVAAEADISRAEDQLTVVRSRLTTAEQAVQDAPTPPQPAPLDDLVACEIYEQEAERTARRLAPESGRFPEAVRDPTLPAQVEAQRARLERHDALVTARTEDVETTQAQVDSALGRYELHINQVIDLMKAGFRDICAEASIDGVIEPVGGADGQPRGVDVRVAHIAGGERRSYRSKEHSTGERAKIAILLLLAAMSIDRAADLLIMDEQFAHLDSGNIDAIAEVMVALRSRVQFILATPTNAEARRLHWCEHQLVFHRRRPDEPYAPPIQLLTKREADESRLAEPDLLSDRPPA